MPKDSTHDDASATGGAEDDFDISAEDHSQDDTPQDSPDDTQIVAADDADKDAGADDTLPSSDDADAATADDKTKADAAADDTPAFDADLDEWAEKTGRGKPENDRERKLIQDIRNGQRDFSRSKDAKKTANDLDKVVADADSKIDKGTDDDVLGDPLEKDVRTLAANLRDERTTRLRSEYFSENDVNDEQVTVMGEILNEKVDRATTPEAKKAALEYWTDPANIADWHDLALLRIAKNKPDATSQAAEKARADERERLAKISASSGPNRSAKSTVAAGKKDELTELWKSDDND